MNAPIKIESNEDSDVVPIACAMASAFADVVADYEKNWGLSREEAIANVYAGDANAIERIRTAPPRSGFLDRSANSRQIFARTCGAAVAGCETSSAERVKIRT